MDFYPSVLFYRRVFIFTKQGGKSKPNMAAMKKLKDFCDIHGIDFTALEEQWNNLGKDN